MNISGKLGAVVHRLGLAASLAPIAQQDRDRNPIRNQLRRLLQQYYASNEIVHDWVPLPNGRRVYANANDSLMHLLLSVGIFTEDFETRTFAGYLRSGDTVFDVGANYGTFALSVLSDQPSIAAAHLFEPNPAVVACLRVTQRRHGTLPLVVHDCAISDRDGEATFHVPLSCASVHGALERHEWGVTHGVFPEDSGTIVAVRTIESICAEYQIRRIDGVKIDVEGHEAAVVRGMSQLLRDSPPRVVMCETAVGSDAYDSLRKHYARVVVARDGTLVPADACGEYWGNIFFTEPWLNGGGLTAQ